MKKLFLLLICTYCLLLLNTCRKRSSFLQKETGIMRDYTGLDGCRFIIESDRNGLLEPVNLNDLGFNYHNGQKVKFTFRFVNSGSICMMGKTVRINKIKEQ